MGFLGFHRKRPTYIINEYHNTYQQATATAIVAAPAPAPVVQPRLPACRNCYSAQRTQRAVTQKEGPNHKREYYVCIGCPKGDQWGKSWIMWADQLAS
ncbi:hypothetical protein E8E12_000990 [Didymella heteroderae]|uniref:GRF-type domain-containing protein n=1 Tax=Didymella heteroderae TaxID=1769908 RepID=A0A9P4WJJ8_9PLEO|nr:hypothetical protein E8E12_000990 [Didymella heteroderae]